MHRKSFDLRLLAAIASLLGGVACSGVGQYVWVDAAGSMEVPPEGEYVISPGDVLSVRVFSQEGMSGKVRVRNDGKVSLPFVNDVEAAGLTPQVLARRLEVKLKAFINTPVVTVALEEPHPVQVSVMGEVAKPGVYRLDTGSNLLHALALAGGLTPYAGRDRIFVLRGRAGSPQPPIRLRFTYESLTRAEGKAATFRLQDGDVLVVE